MPAELATLRITSEELENLLDLNFTSTMALDLYRGLSLGNRKQMFSSLLTEMFIFMLTLIFVVPVSLIVFKGSENSSNNVAVVSQFFLLTFIISGVIFLVWNYYLYQQIKSIKSLAKIVEKVEQYNQIIAAIALLEKIELANNSLNNEQNRAEIKAALSVTRESLIRGLQVETVIRQHKSSIASSYQVFAELENNLTTLMSFDVGNRGNEWENLVKEALEIGLSVHKEVRKIQNK
ncbi:MAG: hypothetical protein SAJ37_05120 [Oscillatoria sp. PMC 1068.18]|nr:hypothetical protein [Oscillatoria sp. PMC 1076.18]MEC4988111.1 hypothetical protein [Oscillatoria sp. PMC 1068.18]